MTKRYIDACASDILTMEYQDKLDSIKLSEGRVLVSESIAIAPPMLMDISNAELGCAFGADIVLLNMYDVNNPHVLGIDSDTPIEWMHNKLGRFVGVNLEPVDENVDMHEKLSIASGRKASMANIAKLIEQGCDFVVLTGNPKTGVTNDLIVKTIKDIRNNFNNDIIVFAGKMHSGGIIDEIGKGVLSLEDATEFIDAGADVLLLPAPGTVPGFGEDEARKLISLAHSKNKLTMTAIGTSQEGSDADTIRRIALMSKMAGTDMHHIGDCGVCVGVAAPENIMAYSITIKGRRHKYRRMARTTDI